MKILLTYIFLLLATAASAQQINLSYKPKGQIIKFHFNSLTIYTDTTALFSVYGKDEGLKDYDSRVKNFVRKNLSGAPSDTAVFSGGTIPLKDSTENKYQNDWYVSWAMLELIKERKLKLYDKHGNLVTTLLTKNIFKKNCFIKRSYINKATKEELFAETFFIHPITPRF